jgi:hypothetical protein
MSKRKRAKQLKKLSRKEPKEHQKSEKSSRYCQKRSQHEVNTRGIYSSTKQTPPNKTILLLHITKEESKAARK